MPYISLHSPAASTAVAGFLHPASSSSLSCFSSSFRSPPAPSRALLAPTSPPRLNPLFARGWGAGNGGGSSSSSSSSRGRGNNNDDGADDMARELSVLEAEQARLMAELEAARLKAQLAKLQQQQAERGERGRSKSSSSSSSKRRGGRDDDSDGESDDEEEKEKAPLPPVSRRTGLQAAVPLSAKGPLAKKKVVEKAWGGPAEGRGGSMTSRATPSLPGRGGEGGDKEGEGGGGALTDPEKEERYAEVVEELVSALQDVSKDSGVDFKTIVRGLKAAREGGKEGGGGLSFASMPATPQRKSAWDEKQVLEAMRKGAGNALVKRIIDGGSGEDEEGEGEGGGSGLERLAAWGSLVEKTITSSKYLLTAEKVLGMKHLADRLLPPTTVHAADITVTHLAVIRAVTQGIAEDYPEVRRRRGNMLYVLLNLPWASRGMGNVHQHAEEVALGAGVSMESSLGLGCRAVFECTLSECLPSSAEALSLMQPEAFRSTTRALVEFGGVARQVLGLTRMPTEEAVKGAAFFLVPWLRRVAKRALESGAEDGGGGAGREGGKEEREGVARLGMVMELGRYAAESLALARGLSASQDPVAFEKGVQAVLAEKVNGIGVELSSSVRSSLLAGYIRQWVEECMLHRSLPVPWEDGEGRLRAGDIAGWDLARQVLSLSEMQLLYVAKETVPVVVGEMMAEVWGEGGGEWPGGEGGFERDWDRVYRRLKYDRYEGGTARTKAVRVMAEKVVEGGKGDVDERREQAIRWGCETLELDREEFESLAKDQGTFELQTLVLEGMLGPGGWSAEELVERIEGEGERMRLDGGSVRKATTAAVQVHIGNLAARALFADMEGQPQKAFKEIESTLRFIQVDAECFRRKLGCEINPTARIADEDGLQLANVCTKMISRRQAPETAKAFLELLGYSDRVGL